MKFLYLILGGGIGTILRYLISVTSSRFFGITFPIGTLIINLLGSFLIGFSFVMLGRDNINPSLKLFLFVGIFGSFTTFSTYMFESYDLIKLGSIKSVILYLGLSNILGLILVYLGFVLGDYIQKP